jgi:hypothetical protein
MRFETPSKNQNSGGEQHIKRKNLKVLLHLPPPFEKKKFF